ncbi:hypothetical protein LAD35_12745 [Comamonas odontotermitis]|nr:hypothetical protein [Comamonas odontotermitis]UBB15729.1 hypothetical protein LAD35_12745 [Comamonas odontotermitis]
MKRLRLTQPLNRILVQLGADQQFFNILGEALALLDALLNGQRKRIGSQTEEILALSAQSHALDDSQTLKQARIGTDACPAGLHALCQIGKTDRATVQQKDADEATGNPWQSAKLCLDRIALNKQFARLLASICHFIHQNTSSFKLFSHH